MRAFLTVLIVVFGMLAVPVAPAAEGDAAARWWSTLARDDRFVIQTQLIILGHYDSLVDGEFGPATLSALKSFQRKVGVSPTGTLNGPSLKRLSNDASARFANLQMEMVEDRETGFSTFLPMSLLSLASTEDGSAQYESKDKGLIFIMLSRPSQGAQLEDVAEALSRPVDGRTVTYTTTAAETS